LHINAIVSANSGKEMKHHVGAGSREQCLYGELLTSFIISAVVIAFMVDRVLHDLTSMMGGGALAVAARIISTLFLKKMAKSLAVLVEVDVFGDAFKRALIFDHSALESPLLLWIASDQCSARTFYCKRNAGTWSEHAKIRDLVLTAYIVIESPVGES
jgi:hypothetical protein